MNNRNPNAGRSRRFFHRRPPVESPPGGCRQCDYLRYCHDRQVAHEMVLCELPDLAAGIDPDADPADWWALKVAETPPNRRGLTWDDEVAAD